MHPTGTLHKKIDMGHPPLRKDKYSSFPISEGANTRTTTSLKINLSSGIALLQLCLKSLRYRSRQNRKKLLPCDRTFSTPLAIENKTFQNYLLSKGIGIFVYNNTLFKKSNYILLRALFLRARAILLATNSISCGGIF